MHNKLNFFRTIRARLTLGLGIMTLIVILSSIGGLYSVFSLEVQINSITDEAGPTIEETDDLIANLWEAAKVANEIMASEDLEEIEVLAKDIIRLEDEFDKGSATLIEIIDDPEFESLVNDAVNEHAEFKIHTENMIKAHRSELEEEIKAKSLLVEFDSQGQELIVRLEEFAEENEVEMAKAEDRGDELAAAGAPSTEVNDVLGELFERDYPVVEAALKLQRLVIEMQDTSGEYLAEEIPENLPAIKTNFDELIKSAEPYFKILSNLAESDEDKDDAKVLRAAFADWIALAFDDEQLFDSYRDQLDAEYQADRDVSELESDVTNADFALEKVAEATDIFMDGADEGAAESVASAITLQLIIIITAIIVGIGAVVLFNRIIINPIKELVKRLEDIAEGEGDLTQRVNDNARDEVGDLARAFNSFVEKIHMLVSDISSSTIDMNSSVSSMHELINSTANGVNEQSQETDSVATAVARLSSNAKEVNSNIQSVSKATADASKEGQEVKSTVGDTVQAIRELANNVENSSEDIQELNREADNIGTVLDVIRGIAEQTNLLALNAAIEAARAGEQGRGFAVVADEVRNLAARTQDSTQEIQTMIEKLQQGTANAVESMEKSKRISDTTVTKAEESGELLDNISKAITTVDNMVEQISTAIDQQASVTADIDGNVDRIVEISQRARTATDESSNHSESLSQLGGRLSGLVSQFKI